MSVPWLVFDISKSTVSFNISSLSTCEKAKGSSFPLPHTSFIVSMLERFLFFTMYLIIGSSMLPALGSHWSYSGIFKGVQNLDSVFVAGNNFLILIQGCFFKRCHSVRQK